MNLKCKLGFHDQGFWQAAVGARNVRKCGRCDKVLEEQTVMDRVTLPPMPRPKGRPSDTWSK